MGVKNLDVTKVLLSNYLPYAKGTIIGRAIPSIDGLKPAQRRILYTMYTMGLLNKDKTKSSNIVGQTMHLHPHGDSAIYETMVRMSVGHDALNVPYVESKGNFGKVYSRDLAFAAARYTEAKLAPICSEIFDGIDEDAVDMIDNFDNTSKEPSLLPVKFPSILVNTSSGIAVGTSSNIPSFGLEQVCNATIGILDGSITDVAQLMDVLGTPEFTTGGYVHASKDDLIDLGTTGKHSFTVSGTVTTYPNKIVVTEIPYKTYVEAIVEAIENAVKAGDLKEVSNARDDTDLHGFKLVIELKRGASPSEVLNKLTRMTNLRMQMSFSTRVIISNNCKELGLLELLKSWIEFRMASIKRIYSFRLDKALKSEHLLESWEKIKDSILEAVEIIAKHDDDTGKQLLMSKFGLDDLQAEYLLDMKVRSISKNNMLKKLKELEDIRVNITYYNKVLNNDSEKEKIIIEDLTRIRDKYKTPRKTHQAGIIEKVDTVKEITPIDDTTVVVVMTKSGYLKRLVSIKDINNFELPAGEEEKRRWVVKNNDYMLVFTYSGEVHKILIDSIDAGRGSLKDRLINLIGLSDESQILYIDMAGDYSGYFNLVYPNGRGTRVYYNKVSGNRSKYKSLYDAGAPGTLFVTKANKFFMITAKRKAAYCDLTMLGMLSSRVAFKVARVMSGDRIFGLQPIENVPNMDSISLEKYNKEYCVCIGNDVLWSSANTNEEEEVADK